MITRFQQFRRALGALCVVSALVFSGGQLIAETHLCHYSAGACSDAGCRLDCGTPRATCVVVHGLGTESCDCQCIMQE